MTRWICEADVAELVGIEQAVDAVEKLLQATAVNRAECRPRQRVRVPGAMLHGMIGGCEYLNRVGWKQYLTTRGGAQFLVGLYDTQAGRTQAGGTQAGRTQAGRTQAGRLLALVEADRLGQLRTGAISGLAVREIYRSDIARLALIGCGWQAESQLAAIRRASTVGSISVYCRDPQRRNAFCEMMQRRTGQAIEPAPDARSAATGAEVVVCITTSRTPVVQSEWLGDCRLLVAAGSNAEDRTEFPPPLVAKASRVICDDIPSCRIEAGELMAAARHGDFRFEQAVSVADYFGPEPPRRVEGLQIFKSVGIASADVAMADLVHRHAIAAGRGIELPVMGG